MRISITPMKVIPFPPGEEVSEQHQNQVLISVLFKLKPGSENKYDENNQVPLKSFTSAVISEDRRSFLLQEAKKIYHHMPLEYFDADTTDYKCIMNFIDKEGEYDKNWHERPLDQQLFIKYKIQKSVGCGHYIRGCQVKCETCSKFYACRLCHDDDEDHDFPRYDTKTVRCNYCETEQPLSQYCIKCSKCFGTYFCQKCRLLCGMGEEAKPNYHCEGCKKCMVGLIENSVHCDQCQSCYNKKAKTQHICVQRTGNCIVCMGDMAKTTYGRVTLKCLHLLHEHCYYELIQKHNYKCPICKRFMPLEREREHILKWQHTIYRRIMIQPEMTGFVVVTKCNDCQKQENQQYHPMQYWCEACQLFNVEVVDEIGFDNAKYQIITEQEVARTVKPRHTTLETVTAVVVEFFNTQKLMTDEFIASLPIKIDESTFQLYAVACEQTNNCEELVVLVRALMNSAMIHSKGKNETK